MILLLLACAGPEAVEDDPFAGEGPDALPLPDFSDVDLSAAANDALRRIVRLDTAAGWAGLVDSVGSRTEGCPDLYAGTPDGDLDELDEDSPGLSWSDTCTTSAGRSYGGYAYWETELHHTAGTEGRRRIVAQAAVSHEGELESWLKGEAEEAFLSSEGHWRRNVTVDWTVEGVVPEGAGLPTEGYRAAAQLELTGGVLEEALTGSGNVFLHGERIEERFDSIEFDLDIQGELGAGPEDCTAEPVGWIGLRDPDAHWAHIVFLPTAGDTGVDAACDGCGTVFVRGVEQDFEACVDLDGLFELASEPAAKDYVLSLRDPGSAP